MDKISLKNAAKPRGVECSIEFAEEADSIIFYIQLKSRAPGEYALVFRKTDETFYTAAIVPSKSTVIPIRVAKEKIADTVEAELLDIETEEAVFTADFTIQIPVEETKTTDSEERTIPKEEFNKSIDESKTAVDSGSPVENEKAPTDNLQSNISEPHDLFIDTEEPDEKFESFDQEENHLDEFDELNFSSIIEEVASDENECSESENPELDTSEHYESSSSSDETFSDIDLDDIFSQFELTEPQAVADFYESSDPPNEESILDEFEDEDAFFNAFENEISFTSDAEDGAHIIDFTPYFSENTDDSEVKLINDNPSCLEEYFTPFSDFEDSPKNREFFSLDSIESDTLRVLLNGYNVPIETPFLEYKNSSVEREDLPKRLIGVLHADNAPEYFIFGCLGHNRASDQPFMGATGFVYFEPAKLKDLGYWMCYINAKTGKISLPIKPQNYES